MKTVISLFAGVGGIDLGFKQAGDFKTVYANEFDKNAQHTFALNFPDVFLDTRDIRTVDADDIKVDHPDVLLAGFPCQPFSIAGYRKGLDDERGDLFFETLRIIKAKQPKAVLLENVKNLVTHDHGNTFKVIREFLVHAGYYIKWKVLNSKDYGNIPQNRERIYVVGFKDKASFDQFSFPEPIKLTTPLSKVIDFEAKLNEITKFGDFLGERYFYREGKQAFYPELKKSIVRSDTIYQWRRQYVRENKSGVVPTLTANMGTGGHNVPLILTNDGQIRKLTPRETFNVQGYPDNSQYRLPEDMANGPLYKEAGNSVVVPVIRRLAENIDSAIDAPNVSLPKTKDKLATVYTRMDGRMEGASFSVHFCKKQSEVSNWLKENNSASLPVFENDDFYEAIKKGGNYEFYTIVG